MIINSWMIGCIIMGCILCWKFGQDTIKIEQRLSDIEDNIRLIKIQEDDTNRSLEIQENMINCGYKVVEKFGKYISEEYPQRKERVKYV